MSLYGWTNVATGAPLTGSVTKPIVERARDERGPVVRQIGAAEKHRRRDRLRKRRQDRHVVHVERIERNRPAVGARAARSTPPAGAARHASSGAARRACSGGAARPRAPSSGDAARCDGAPVPAVPPVPTPPAPPAPPVVPIPPAIPALPPRPPLPAPSLVEPQPFATPSSPVRHDQTRRQRACTGLRMSIAASIRRARRAEH